MSEQKTNDIYDKIPSKYDHFHCTYWMVKNLDPENFKKFITTRDPDIEESFRGYLYMLELSIIDTISNFELLISDDNTRELVQYGGDTFDDYKFKENIKDQPELDYILKLNQKRKELAKIRFKKDFSEDIYNEVSNLYDELRLKLNDIHKEIHDNYDISMRDENIEKEMDMILNYIINKYNYIESDCGVDLVSKPLFPGINIPYTIPRDKFFRSYCLQYDKIKQLEKEYLNGYKLSLLFLYYRIIPEVISGFEEEILSLEKWTELHSLYTEIHNESLKSDAPFFRLYDIGNKNNITPQEGKIKNKEMLKEIFKGRQVKVITDVLCNSSTFYEKLFIQILVGELLKSKSTQEAYIEIVEFKKTTEDSDLVNYTYAIYFPFQGPFTDTSRWIIFDDLISCPEDYYSSMFHLLLNNFEKDYSETLIVHKYGVNDEIFNEFLRENDEEFRIKHKQKEQLKAAKGLLGESLALFNYLKEDDRIPVIDFHRDMKDTDADVIFDSGDNLLVIQSKSSYEFNYLCDADVNGNISKILSHFNKLSNDESLKDEDIEKVLFIMNVPTEPFDGVIQEDVEDKEQLISRMNDEGIEVVFWKDFKEKLKEEGEYDDLLSKIELVFS